MPRKPEHARAMRLGIRLNQQRNRAHPPAFVFNLHGQLCRRSRHKIEEIGVQLAENEKEVLLLELFPMMAHNFLAKKKQKRAHTTFPPVR